MKLRTRPRLKEPIFLAAWPGMGLVAYKSVSYLIEKLRPTLLGTIEAEDRFPLRSVAINDGLVEPVDQPDGCLFSCSGAARQDLLLFLGDEQPVAGKEWSLATEVLTCAEQLGCRQLYTFAAMPRRIDHHRHPAVWGVATDRDLLQRLEEHDIRIMEEGSISGLNGVLLGIAKRRGWEGYCLLGEIPLYATQLENPKSCHAVLERICALTALQVDLDDLRLLGEMSAAQLDLIFQQISQEEGESVGEEGDDQGPLN